MDLETRHTDLAELVRGASWKQLFSTLYRLALVRYGTHRLLNPVNIKIATKRKLKKLVNLGYLSVNPTGVYTVTPKCLNLLKEHGYNTKILQKDFTGQGTGDTLVKSAVILNIMRDPDFYSVFYPNFTYLIPDACIVYKKGDKARLAFLEVEQEKGNWQMYLEKKRENYLKLAREVEVYSKWWKRWSGLLDMNYCKPEEFCFSVLCYSDIRFHWEGWEFERIK